MPPPLLPLYHLTNHTLSPPPAPYPLNHTSQQQSTRRASPLENYLTPHQPRLTTEHASLGREARASKRDARAASGVVLCRHGAARAGFGAEEVQRAGTRGRRKKSGVCGDGWWRVEKEGGEQVGPRISVRSRSRSWPRFAVRQTGIWKLGDVFPHGTRT